MPRTKASFEWDIETRGLMANDPTIADVLDHNHQDRLDEFDRRALDEAIEGASWIDQTTSASGSHYEDRKLRASLVLVRDEWEMRGKEPVELGLRLWAYVEDGKLPEFFSTNREVTTIRVPARFHRELSRITGGAR